MSCIFLGGVMFNAGWKICPWVGIQLHLSLTLSFGLGSLACQADTNAMLLCAQAQAHMEHHMTLVFD